MLTQLFSMRRAFSLPLVAIFLGTTACQPPTADNSSPNANAGGGNVSLVGAGATFPAPFYQRCFNEYNQQNPNIRVSYQSVGSGAGVQQFTQGTVDFGASDVAITKEERQKIERGALTIPLTAGAIVLAYNLPGVEKPIRLPREIYPAIFLGEINNWNNPQIAQANPGVNLPDLPITIVRRSDGSGTTAVFTQHLSEISPQWKSKVGAGTAVNWPMGVGSKGNEGVTAQIQQTQGAIGYIEYGYAKQNKIPYAAIENNSGNYVVASSETTANALASIELPENLVSFARDPKGEQSYPIVTYTWLLVYDQYQDQQKAQTMQNVVEYALNECQKFSEELGYVPLPKTVVDKIEPTVQQITGSISS
ncbi:phosphate ABC transporter substrate-binding protein PstS [Nostoc flagelliforme FACHB-838]|uniref:Phosphate-binding protein n=1 Tax=Nostoc flagelliforme FACHB-838 TaxID=2692904 RepID=A0ABR8E279_9NOSO|nr:phosphate ABC transporter substrate-binding protein PstS [Nostoc flagelliforme]MBD2535615.1 phosphate ABC transporter substrate-binding protein PstS [Nostoc flagelliforme FACHB-838]